MNNRNTDNNFSAFRSSIVSTGKFLRAFVLIIFAATTCFSQLPDADWHAAIKLNDTLELPFTFTSLNNQITIHNSDEKILVNEITFIGDSVIIQMPVFDAEFRCILTKGNLAGNFINHARKDNNILPFHAESGLSYRFSDKPERSGKNITGRYRIVFDGEDELSKETIGVFNQDGNRLTGTFLTVTGDYRFLEGEVNGKRIWLSAFDGSHLFLFTALIKGDSLINGEYFSGKHWHDTWRGIRDEKFSLPDPDKLIEFSENGIFNFSFPDENGKIVSLSDDQYKDRPMIIQIMGTWCPNCMDETKYLSQWYSSLKREIGIIALDFERITDSATVRKNIRRLKKKFDIEYPVLFAGSNDKTVAAKNLKLTRLLAFPTLIFLSRDKKIVRIHTGFSGPATGEEYLKFQKWFAKSVAEL